MRSCNRKKGKGVNCPYSMVVGWGEGWIMDKLCRLHRKMEAKAIDALIVTGSENRRYLSGFTGSAGTFNHRNSNIFAYRFPLCRASRFRGPRFRD